MQLKPGDCDQQIALSAGNSLINLVIGAASLISEAALATKVPH